MGNELQDENGNEQGTALWWLSRALQHRTITIAIMSATPPLTNACCAYLLYVTDPYSNAWLN